MSEIVPIDKARPLERRFKLVRFDEIKVGPEPEWRIEHVLPARGLTVIYGEPSSGKSFLAADMALHIAMGRSWAGKTVRSGKVVYISAEGAIGFRKRIAAFRDRHDIKECSSFYLISDCPDLGDQQGDTSALIASIKASVGGPVDLVIIDTLARTMMGREENSASDMGAYVANCNRIGAELDCAVVVVHHSGKDGNKGARGSSALKAAADTEIKVTGTSGSRTAQITKSKDHEAGLTISFTLVRHEFEADGRLVNSCIVEAQIDCQGASDQAEGQLQRSSEVQKKALAALEQTLAEKGRPSQEDGIPTDTTVCGIDDWREACKAEGLSSTTTDEAERQAFRRARKSLLKEGLIEICDNEVWLL